MIAYHLLHRALLDTLAALTEVRDMLTDEKAIKLADEAIEKTRKVLAATETPEEEGRR